MANISHYLGRAGEYAVASQLLLRGVNVCFPSVDSGVDLIAGCGVKIQVKSARKLRNGRSGSLGYTFNAHVRMWDSEDKLYRMTQREWSDVADFFVFWGSDENRFWISPAELLNNVSSIRLAVESQRFTIDIPKVLELHERGLDQYEIADSLDIDQASVSRIINGWRPKSEPGLCATINKLEDAWDDLIAAATKGDH